MNQLKNLSPHELILFLQEKPLEPVDQFVGILLKDSQGNIGLETFECTHDWELEDLFDSSEFVDESGLPELINNLEEGQDIEEFIGWVMLYPNKLNLPFEGMTDFIVHLFNDELTRDSLISAFELIPQEV